MKTLEPLEGRNNKNKSRYKAVFNFERQDFIFFHEFTDEYNVEACVNSRDALYDARISWGDRYLSVGGYETLNESLAALSRELSRECRSLKWTHWDVWEFFKNLDAASTGETHGV